MKTGNSTLAASTAVVLGMALLTGYAPGAAAAEPWTWEAQEIFQVNGAGKISRIEAVLQSVPYGMRPGWTTGVHLPSESVRRDGFKEY